MVKPNKIISNCTGFEWDQGNDTQNRDKHDVSNLEGEQIFFNKPLLLRRDKEHAITENRYYALGRTNMGRLLFTVFTIRKNTIKIISAREATDAEMERYFR